VCRFNDSALHALIFYFDMQGAEKAKKKRKVVTTPVSVEKLILRKFAKIKSRQDAL
jgi:hypothetical protein